MLIGDGRAMRVLGVCSLDVKMNSKADFNVKLREVNVTEGIGSNLVQLHDVHGRQIVTVSTRMVHTLLIGV